jgi:hypothetical protein
MLQEFKVRLERLMRTGLSVLRPILKALATAIFAFVRGPLRSIAKYVLQTVAALVLIFFEWGWRPLSRALAYFAKYKFIARLEASVARLPKYQALALFAAPAILLFPLKLFALYLFATGHPLLGVGLIVSAKVVGTAFVARIFILTQPQLMQIAWFAAAHDRFVPWKEQMFDAIRSSAAWRNGRILRVATKRAMKQMWITLRPQRAWLAEKGARLIADIRQFVMHLTKELR